jgi:hypothetical protein
VDEISCRVGGMSFVMNQHTVAVYIITGVLNAIIQLNGKISFNKPCSLAASLIPAP